MKKILLFLILSTCVIFSQPYPDQHYFYERENLVQQVESLNGIEISSDGKRLFLSDEFTIGSVVFKPDSS